MHPGGVEEKHSTGPGEVSEKCRQAQDRGSRAKNWRPSLCQGEVPQDQATIQETLRKEPGPIQCDRKTRHPLHHPLSPVPVLLHPPSLPCITTGTHTTQPISSLTAATTTTATVTTISPGYGKEPRESQTWPSC